MSAQATRTTAGKWNFWIDRGGTFTDVVARTPEFRFAREFCGMEVLPREGDVIAYDDGETIRAPYDNCVLVMPVPNNVKTGLTAVRLGRIEAP